MSPAHDRAYKRLIMGTMVNIACEPSLYEELEGQVLREHAPHCVEHQVWYQKYHFCHGNGIAVCRAGEKYLGHALSRSGMMQGWNFTVGYSSLVSSYSRPALESSSGWDN